MTDAPDHKSLRDDTVLFSDDANEIKADVPLPGNKTAMKIIFGGLLFLSLGIVSRYNFLLFHTLAEFFSITVAFSLFVLVWNSRHLSHNAAFVFMGVAYLFVGSIDMAHTLSYKGMGVIPAQWGADPATQLWIAARFVESISLFIFPLVFFRQLRLPRVFAAYGVITVLVFITIFYWRIFPECYVEPGGLTRFKKVSEYLICIILMGAWGALYQKRRDLDPIVYLLISWSLVMTIFAELVFTFYGSVYGLSNLAGHYFKLVSYYLIYLALVRSSYKNPYETLFRDLAQSERKFKSLFEEMISGLALHEIISNKEGKAVDYRFLDLNAAFEKMTGLKRKDLIGKTVLEVLPKTEHYWIENYGQVALTGKTITFENYSEGLDKYFEVRAYSPNPGQFVTMVNDITDKRTADREKDKLIKDLKRAAHEIKTLRGILPICSICKQIRDDKGYWNQIEVYIRDHSEVDFSHSICPECAAREYPDLDLYE